MVAQNGSGAILLNMTPNRDGRRMGGILEFEYTLATDSESTPKVFLDGIVFEVALDSTGRGLTAAELCECLLIQNHLDQYGCVVLIPIPVGTHPIIHTPLHACAAQVQRSTTTDRDVDTSAPPRWTCEPRWGRLMDRPTRSGSGGVGSQVPDATYQGEVLCTNSDTKSLYQSHRQT